MCHTLGRYTSVLLGERVASKAAGWGSNPHARAEMSASPEFAAMIDLWLDDERDPRNVKIQELFNADPEMLWVKTAQAAISRLKTGQVRSISLDHDLGTTATGYDVARWIEERAASGELPRLAWCVHSMNVEGVRAMRTALMNADRYWSAQDGDITAPDC